ncbi:hypothetical protein [Hymenobacter sp. IS2118]|uniref:hypothetical protein n=1 Tax=Hymenobacter sp. IS2118 TaxID=1505605 RepID=UPI0012690CCA|nr:hypothetical protein [Hymenobacter sp. IS2118]
MSLPYRVTAASRNAQPVNVGIDFITPDGLVVPYALGKAALQSHTAILVGGLLAGFFPKN